MIGAVIGTLSLPTAIVAGLYQDDGTLRMVGRSTSLTRAQSHALAAADEHHPWPDTVAATRFGSGHDRVTLTKVQPTVIAEITADAARQHGVWRHPLRFVRTRADLTVHADRRSDSGT